MPIYLFYIKRYENEKERFGTIFFSAIKESSGKGFAPAEIFNAMKISAFSAAA
jgi:hypothetical protein